MRATIEFKNVREIEAILNAIARQYTREQDRQLPPLYLSGVQYEREDGTEDWLNPWQLYQRGRGDCEDLATARAAELIREGIDLGARVILVQTGPKTWHAIVERSDGSREDPSRALGMLTNRLGQLPAEGWQIAQTIPQGGAFPASPPAGTAPQVPPGGDPLEMVAMLYPGAGIVIKLLKNPTTRKFLIKTAKKLARFV